MEPGVRLKIVQVMHEQYGDRQNPTSSFHFFRGDFLLDDRPLFSCSNFCAMTWDICFALCSSVVTLRLLVLPAVDSSGGSLPDGVTNCSFAVILAALFGCGFLIIVTIG